MPKLRNRILSVALSIVVVLAAAFFLQSTNLDSETPPELDAKSELTGALTTGSGAAYYYDSNSPAFTGDASNTVSANAGSVKYLYSDQNQTLSDFIARIDGRNSIVSNDRGQSPGQFRFVNFGGVNSGSKYKVYPIEYFTSNYDSTKYCCEALSLDSEIKRNQVVIVYNSGDYEYKNNPTSAEMGTGEVDLGYQGWHLVYLGSNNQISTPNGLGVLSAYLLNANGSSNKVFSNSGSDNFSVTSNGVYWVKVGNVSASSSNGLPNVPDEGSQVANNQDSNASSGSAAGSAGSGDGSAGFAGSESKPLYQYTERNVSVGNINANCFNSLMGSGNSMGNFDSSCNQLTANLESDNPEVVNALLASLRTDQEELANQAQDEEVVLGEDGQPIDNIPEFAAAERIFANTVNVLHFDNNVTYEACEQSQAIEYLDFRLALINNYNQALSLNSIDIGLTEENRQSIVSASLEGFTYNTETGILTANNPISMQSVTNDDSSYLFDLRIGVRNTADDEFVFTFAPTFGITQAGEQEADFVASMVYGNGSSIRVEEAPTNCSGPDIPRPSGKLVVSALASDETNQCADIEEIGQAYVGSMIELTNTDVFPVSVSEITLRFSDITNLDLVRSSFNGVTGSLGEGNTRLVFTFDEVLVINPDATQTFELKLYNVDGFTMNLSLVDLDIQGTLPNGDRVENLYASMPTNENPVSYVIDVEEQCLPDAVSNVTYTSMFGVTASSSVCSDSQHETLSNSILVVETDENNSHSISSLTFDITKSVGSDLGDLTYTLVDGPLRYDGVLNAAGDVVSFNFQNPIEVEESRVFELLVDSDLQGAEGNLTLVLQQIANAEVDVDVELNYEFIVDEALCPIVAPYYEVSNVSSLSRNYCQNIDEVSGSSFDISVDILNREEEVTQGSVTLTFQQALPEGITFDRGAIAEDELSVTFANNRFEVGVNRLNFMANFDAGADNSFRLKVTNVDYDINSNTGSYLVSSNDGVFEIESTVDCSDDSSPFMQLIGSSANLSYCVTLLPDPVESSYLSVVFINPTDDVKSINSLRLATNLDSLDQREVSVNGLVTDSSLENDLLTLNFDSQVVEPNSALEFKIDFSSDLEYDFTLDNIVFASDEENILSSPINVRLSKDFNFECPDPGTVTLAFAESAEKTTCLDVPEISKSFSERLTINNTTGESVTSDLVLTFAGDDDISNFEFELGGTQGSVAGNTVTFEGVSSNTDLNIYDLNIEYTGDTSQRFELDFALAFNEELLEGQSLNYNFINCQSKVQVLAQSESKDVCSFVGGYNLDTEIVIYNPTLEALSFNTIELTYSEDELGNATFTLNNGEATNNENTNILEFNYDNDLVIGSNQSLILPLSITSDDEFSYTINSISVAEQDIALDAIYAVSNDENQCPEPGVVELVVSEDVEAKVCTDIEGLPNTYTHRVEILNGHDEEVDVVLVKEYDPVILDSQGQPILDLPEQITLVPGLNIHEIEIDTSNTGGNLSLSLSLADNVNQDLVSLGASEDTLELNVDFDNNCFQSSMTLDTVELSRGVNMCFLEGGEFEFNFVFNNNTQEQKSVSSLSIGLEDFNQDDGDSLEVYVDNEIQNGVYNSDSGEYTFTNPVGFEANDAYVITVKFMDAAVDNNVVSIDVLTLNFNSGSLSLREGQENTINLTNDLSDCEGLVITGVSSFQDYCVVNSFDEFIYFIFTVYNPTDQDFEFFIDSDDDGNPDSFFLDVSNLIEGFDFNFENSIYFTSQMYSVLDLSDNEYVTSVSSDDSISFGLVYSKSDGGTLAEEFNSNNNLNYQITLPDDVNFSPASNLTSEVRVEESENCGNVIAPENLLVSAQVTENVELPYCVYDGLVTRNVPVTVVNRYSEDIQISNITLELENSNGENLSLTIDGFTNGTDGYTPDSNIVLSSFEEYTALLQIESSLLYSGDLELTVNANKVSNAQQLDAESTTISLNVNATNGEECSEDDVLSFSQTKDSLIINSVGRYPYTSSRDPLGVLYVNTSHLSYPLLSRYGIVENDKVFDHGMGIFSTSSDVIFKNYIANANDLFYQLNFLDDQVFTYPLTTGEVIPFYQIGSDTTNLPVINFDIDVYRFASNWNLENINVSDHVYKYSIDFNMPENVDKLKLNVFNLTQAPEYNQDSQIIPVSYFDAANIANVFESFQINLINNDGSSELIESTNSNESDLINYIVSELDFSNYKTLELIIDYPNDNNLYIPDAVFFEDKNTNSSLDLAQGITEVVGDNVLKFIDDSSYPSIRTWITSTAYSPIADNEFYIGSPITDLNILQ